MRRKNCIRKGAITSNKRNVKNNEAFETVSGVLLEAHIAKEGSNESNEMKGKVNRIVDVRAIGEQL